MRHAMDEPLDLDALAAHPDPLIARLARACAYWMRMAHTHAHTNSQRAYYWGVVVRDIAAHTGMPEQDVHSALRARYLPPGETSTSALDSDRYSIYMEHCIAEAASLGVVIPFPDDVGLV